MNSPYNQNSYQQPTSMQQEPINVKDENSMAQASTTNPVYTQASVNPSYAQTTPSYPLYSGNQYTNNTQQNPGMDNTQQQQPTVQTNQQQPMQTPDIRLQKNNSSSGTLLPPYIPTVRQIQVSGYPGYILPSDEIQKMLHQNANIIRKCISDVEKGKLIDATEYSGLHTSVYLLSLFTKSKVAHSKPSVPVSVYKNLINKMKQVEMIAQNNNNNNTSNNNMNR